MYTNPDDPRDHRRLGRDHDLFRLDPSAPGGVFWRPKGWAMFQRLCAVARSANALAGYEEVQSPDVLDRALWERSGHWEAYGPHMMPLQAEGRDLALKPMNCPGHAMLYNFGPRHESALPIRLAEFGRVHRMEPSGALHGLLRLRSFTQDDGHAFCAPHQVAQEVARLDAVAHALYAALGFGPPEVSVSLRPESRIGGDDQWDDAEAALCEALSKAGRSFAIQPGEGAFYGPKIEYALRDARGRSWQCGTIQLDFHLPQRFGCQWFPSDGGAAREPVLVHRAFLGSLERFLAILLERDAPHFPAWLAPLGVVVLPVSERHVDAVNGVVRRLRHVGVDAVPGLAEGALGGRMKGALSQGPACLWVVGDKEAQNDAVAVRVLSKGEERPRSLPVLGAIEEVLALRALPVPVL
jgi:threonyl-tRNA synthetase